MLVDRNGRVFADLAPVRRVLVPLAKLPATVPAAFVAIEDKRFEQHHGVDWRRVFGALAADLRAGGFEQGFSTITMQLARNAFPDALPASRRTLWRKLMEIGVARTIEDRFRKREILELYLNHIYFGNGLYGIEPAAEFYFGHPASRLTLPESALLAALPKAPTHYDPRRFPDRARERRNLVLAQMAEQGRIPRDAAARAKAAPLGVTTHPQRVRVDLGPAPYFVEEVRRELESVLGEALYARKLRVQTTLDAGVHRAAAEELRAQIEAIERGRYGRFPGPVYRPGAVETGSTPYLQGAAVVLDAASGGVLAWVGGRSYDHSAFDRAGRARRQIGSAFKPFIYAVALREGFRWSDRLEDTPLAVKLPNGETWQPRNISGRYQSSMTLREALVRSENVPTVRLALRLGLPRIIATARRCGLPVPSTRHPSLALGAVAATPLELAAAYTPFANLGERREPYLVERVTAPDGEVIWEREPPRRRVEALDPAIAYLVTDALAEAVDRGSGAGVRQAGYRGPAAGKTGTTNESTDAWFVGYTPTRVGAVWIGFDRPRPIAVGATGGGLAAPVWGRLMRRAEAGRPHPGWETPDGVVRARVDLGTGKLLASGCGPEREGRAREEIYLEDTEPERSCPHVESLEGVIPWLWYRITS